MMHPFPSALANRLHDFVRPSITAFLAGRWPLVWLLSVAVGLLASVGSVGFRLAIGLVQSLWLGTGSERMIEVARAAPDWLILLGPVAGGAVVGVLLYLLPDKRAAAVPDVIEARAFPERPLRLWPGLGSAAISAISLGAGGSAGREGPVVHLGAALAASLGRHFHVGPAGRRTLLAAGAAAAVSASFNAPIAGILFAQEVILAHFAASSLVPITIASVIGAVLSRIIFGPYPAFVVPDYQITSYWEFPAFALLGIVCAAVAIIFQIAVIGTDRIARRIVMPLWFRPILGGALVGGIGLAFPETLGVGYEATDRALGGQLSLALLLLLLAAKTAATAITLASRFGGGVFSPTLYLGAMAGGAFGIVAASVFPDLASSDGLYAILGMGAVAAAVLGAPISTAVMVFELTGGYAMTIALLITVSIANGLNQAVIGRSLFHWQLETRGLFLREGPHRAVLRSVTVGAMMTRLDAPEPFDPQAAPWLTPADNLEKALRHFDATGASRIAVVDSEAAENQIGFLDKTSALSAYNEALVALSIEEHR